MPTLCAMFLLKKDSKKSVTAVVDNKKKDEEKTIFLSNSVNFSCE
jgi:hypothetical protein